MQRSRKIWKDFVHVKDMHKDANKENLCVPTTVVNGHEIAVTECSEKDMQLELHKRVKLVQVKENL